MIVSPAGCAADGTTDDRVALQTAINAAATNGDILLLDGKTYAVSAPGLTVPSGASILGARKRSILKAIGSGWNGALLNAIGSYGVSTGVNSTNGGPFLSSATTLVMPGSVNGFSAGDLVMFENTDTWGGQQATHRQVAKLNYINGGSLYFTNPLLIPTTGSVRTVYQLHSVSNITIRDIVLDGSAATGAVVQGLYAYIGTNNRFDLTAQYFQNAGFRSWIGYQNDYRVETIGCDAPGDDASISINIETSLTASLLRSYLPQSFGTLLVDIVDFKIGLIDNEYAQNGRGIKIASCLFGTIDEMISCNSKSSGVSLQAACGRMTINKATCFNNGWADPGNGFTLNGYGSGYVTVRDLTAFGNAADDLAIGPTNYNTRVENAAYGTYQDQGSNTLLVQ